MVNKRSQIGATLSWFVATLIIFFIIILFLSATIIFSGNKKITSGSDKIKFEKKTSELINFEVLLGFLNKKIIFDNENLAVKNIITKGLDKEKRTTIKAKLKEELDKLIKEDYNENFNENNCYLFDIDYGSSNLGINNENSFDICSFTCTDEKLNEYVDHYKDRLLIKGISFDLYSEKGVIQIKFYLGGC